MVTLLKPDCWLGYTRTQLETMLDSRLSAFDSWMQGQTMALCDGRVYDPEEKIYKPSVCDHPHGVVVYPQDVEQFLLGRRPLD